VGIVIFTMFVVVGKFVNVLLSVVKTELQTEELWFTTLIFYLIGITMLLLPPVPGVPVYLTGGVLLVDNAKMNFKKTTTGVSDGTLFAYGLLYTIFIAFIIKLSAVAMQQKLIGERMGKSLYVRTNVAVNSVPIQAIRIILTRNAFSVASIAILCGGPDWPTSVLTGILRLNVWKMLLGTLPVIVLIGLTTCSGAFLAQPEYETVSKVAIMGGLLSQAGALMTALYYINREISKRGKEIQDHIRANLDVDVFNAEKLAELKSARRKEVCRWQLLPLWMKLDLLCGYLTMTISCWFFGMFGNMCWEDYQVTDNFKTKLNGKLFNIVKSPWGWVALGLFFVSSVNYTVSRYWISARVKRSIEATPLPPIELMTAVAPESKPEDLVEVAAEVPKEKQSGAAQISEPQQADSKVQQTSIEVPAILPLQTSTPPTAAMEEPPPVPALPCVAVSAKSD